MKTAVLLLPLLAGCGAGTLVHYRLSPDYPRDESRHLALPGLRQPVRILYDSLGVPHIEAQDELDLVRAVGFAQGRDRFFEMDMMRRFARGRVSELVGDKPLFSGTTVDFDRSMRGWDFEQRAAEIVARQSASDRAILEAFCAGVNAAVALYPPLEHRLLRVAPERWTPEDVWVVGLLNAWTVSHNWQQELARFSLALSVGVDRAEAIYPAEPLAGGTTLPPQGPPRALPPSVVPQMRTFLAGLEVVAQPGAAEASAGTGLLALAGASNAWVVSGAHSRSGKPVLANDPHLSHLVPSIVFQEHLKAPGLDVVGVTIPGIPWVLMGHNARVAWGITSTVADVMDLVVERPDPARPDRVLHEGGDCPLVTREAVLRVNRGRERSFALRRTCNGPLLNDMLPQLLPPGAPLVAVRWRLEGVEASLGALARIDRVRSVDELRKEAMTLSSPSQTITAADVEGHIGTFITGTVPRRRTHRGTFPIPGWLAAYEWDGAAPADSLPRGMDPPSGFFAHANNLMVDPRTSDAPVNVDAAPSYRYDRIAERLAMVEQHDASSIAAIQRDVKLLRAVRVLPKVLEDLAGLTPRSETDRQALDLLRSWNFEGDAGSAAAAIFLSTYRYAVIAAIEDELPRPARDFFLSQRYSTNVADGWFDRVDHPVWDRRQTPGRESRTDIVREAFTRAVDDLVGAQGADPHAWRWGALHQAEPRHAFGGSALLAGLVNLEPTPMGGELDSVWKSHFELGNDKAPFRDVAGPVYRMVVDLADLAHGRWVVDTGASGWPGSPHYGDQYQLWRKGELAPMVFDWPEVEQGAQAELVLEP